MGKTVTEKEAVIAHFEKMYEQLKRDYENLCRDAT
jgi:hypothetical protein